MSQPQRLRPPSSSSLGPILALLVAPFACGQPVDEFGEPPHDPISNASPPVVPRDAEALPLPPELAEVFVPDQAERLTVRDGDQPLFTVWAQQTFFGEDEAQLVAPELVDVAVVFPDASALHVRYERQEGGGYLALGDGTVPIGPTLEAEQWGPELRLSDFTLSTAAFALRRPNFVHAVAVADTWDLSKLVAKPPNYEPLPDWNEGWDEHCYDKDFECTDQGPLTIPESITLHWVVMVGFFKFQTREVTVDWTDCCLEHDRAFFCGGDGWQFLAANAQLAGCVADQVFESGAPWYIRGPVGVWWWSVFFFGTNVGNAVQGFSGWPAPGEERFEQRSQSCLCGGEEPTPLCDEPCLVNDCSLPQPQRNREPAWDDWCEPHCEWWCQEQGGKDQWVTRMCDWRADGSHGHCVTTECPAGPAPAEGCPPE